MHCTSIILIIKIFGITVLKKKKKKIGITKIPKKGFRYPIDISLKA